MVIRILLIAMVSIYGAMFSLQEEKIGQKEPYLSMALPSPVQHVLLGFLKEVGSELLFVKASVFWGRLDLPEQPEVYAASLAQNFDVMTDLYPEFADPYYLCQSSLAYVNYDSALRTNDILLKGIEAYPDVFAFPFFRGFNLYYYMDDFNASAAIYRNLATRSDAPSWLGHLAGVLSARGGDLYGGLMTLKAMMASEKDEIMRQRYERDIGYFQSAISVHDAIIRFNQTKVRYPDTLDELIPSYLSELPSFEDGFALHWNGKALKLVRPLKKSELQ